MNSSTDRVRLADAIAAMRKELRVAAERAQSLPERERYKITEAEIELSVVAEDSTELAGEVGWWVLKAKAQSASKDSSSHKIKLRLNVGDIEVGSTTQTM